MKIVVSKEQLTGIVPVPLSATTHLVKELIIRVEIGNVAVGDETVIFSTGAKIEQGGSRSFDASNLDVTELDLNQVYIVGSSPAAKIHYWAFD